MRHVLIDHARDRQTAKRESGLERVPFDDPPVLSKEQSDELLALNDALESLAQFDARQSRIVELRFLGGLTVEETADALGISPKTVKRDWTAIAVKGDGRDGDDVDYAYQPLVYKGLRIAWPNGHQLQMPDEDMRAIVAAINKTEP